VRDGEPVTASANSPIVQRSRLIDPLHFRRVVGQFPTGVVIVAALGDDGRPCGMSVGSFASASLDPPMIVFLPARASSSWPQIQRAETFAISVLAAEQERICRAFAISGANKFIDVEWKPAPSGAPVINGSLAWLDCELEQVHGAGDHYLVVARVNALDVGRETSPLVFFQSGYGRFHPQPHHLVGSSEEESCVVE
jgi:flavin reductase (DIM6/NTAB) family NADH-FMN oxidoreductase RutF